jgi:glycosyltransferase involved in cell wall biosynthesis
MQSPPISIIIPAYNHEKFVADAIRSVLNQSFEDFEMIVIDDGSTDNTVAEIKKFDDPRIRLFRQTNIGAAATINRGIDLSQGRYITILNSDDMYHPERLSQFKQYMDENPDTMVLSSLIQPVDNLGNSLKIGSGSAFHDYWLEWYETAVQSLQQNGDFFYSLLQSNFVVTTSNMFLNSRIFQKENKFPNLSYCHDYAFLLRALQSYPFGFLQKKLLQYRLHETNTILHEHFLKRIEIQYALYHALDFEDVLIGSSSMQRKMSSIVYRGLEKNPDINHEIRLAEKDRMLEKSDRWLKELQSAISQAENRLMQTEGRIECLQTLAAEKDMRILERDNQLHLLAEENRQKDEHLHRYAEEVNQKNIQLVDIGRQIDELKSALQLQCQKQINDQAMQEEHEIALKTQIHQMDMQLQEADRKIIFLEQIHGEKERFLQEIFASKGWRWLTRYRDIKQNLVVKPKSSLEQQAQIDEKTYHTKVLYPRNPKRVKVVHALANFLTGGSSRLVVDLVEHLGHKYDQEVISFFIPTPLAYAGVVLHDFSGDVAIERIETFLKKKNPQILHVHYWGEGDAKWYRKVFQAAENWPGILIENVNTPVVPYISDRVNHYVYVSEYAKKFAACEADKSSVIYPGSNLALFDRNQAPIPDNVIGMVYRLDSDKLKEDAIRVFIQVVKKRPRTRVLIVGGGEFLSAYQRQVAEEGATANFEFTGYVPYGKLPEYYQQMSIFVAPVWKESFGQVSPFAMSMKIPVAGYRIGALSEILGNEGLLATHPDDLSDIIVNLLDDRERRIEIGRNNHLRAHERFSVEAMVAAYDRIYERLIQAHEPGGAA